MPMQSWKNCTCYWHEEFLCMTVVADNILHHRFWLPTCLSTPAQFLAEAAAYIACRNKSRIFSFKWCQEDPKGAILTERSASMWLCVIPICCVD